MNKRHKENSNLILHNKDHYCGIPLQIQRGDLIQNYLKRIEETIRLAVKEHHRTLAVRVDLHLPAEGTFNSDVISKFTDSLNAQIGADSSNKRRLDKRVHPCTLRFIWVKEKHQSTQFHYHVLLLLNRDRYHCLGDYKNTAGNTAARIKRAWASALNIYLGDIAGLVHFPNNPEYTLNFCSDNDPKSRRFQGEFFTLFKRVSYFAKAKTKHYGDGSNSFGCSRR